MESILLVLICASIVIGFVLIFYAMRQKNYKHPFQSLNKESKIDLLGKIEKQIPEYFLYHDTLLGAVKYGCFIPWRDCVDIAVPKNTSQIIDTNCYKYEIMNDKVIIGDFKFDKADIYPLIKIKFCDIFVNIPQNSPKILDTLFQNWRTTCISDPHNNSVSTPCSQLSVIKNDLFDNVWVINLERRKDRLDNINKSLSTIGIIPNVFKAIDAEQERISPVEACMYSHVSLWKKLMTNNADVFFILEDDAKIDPDVDKDKIMKVVDTFQGFDLIYLGNCEPFSRSGLGGAFCLHAYIVSKNGLKKLLSEEPYIEVDRFVRNMCEDGKMICYIAGDDKDREGYGHGLIRQSRNKLGSDLRSV